MLRLFAGSLALAASLGAHAQAASQWQICNRTKEALWVATGVGNRGPGPILTTGWHGLTPGSCTTLNFKGIYQEAHLHAYSQTRYFAISDRRENLCVVKGQNFRIPDGLGRCDPKLRATFHTVVFSGNRLTTSIQESMGFVPARAGPIDRP